MSHLPALATVVLSIFLSYNIPTQNVNKAVRKIGVLEISGVIDKESTETILKNFDLAEKSNIDVLVIEFNTPGGSVDSGMQIAKRIERSPKPVVCVVDGQADSMGFYLLQSCPVRIMTKRSMLMTHEPSVNIEISGKKQQFQDIIDILVELSNAMAEHESARMCVSKQELMEKIDNKDWWMGWEEALAVGAVDYVVPNFNSVTDVLRYAPEVKWDKVGIHAACLK